MRPSRGSLPRPRSQSCRRDACETLTPRTSLSATASASLSPSASQLSRCLPDGAERWEYLVVPLQELRRNASFYPFVRDARAELRRHAGEGQLARER